MEKNEKFVLEQTYETLSAQDRLEKEYPELKKFETPKKDSKAEFLAKLSLAMMR